MSLERERQRGTIQQFNAALAIEPWFTLADEALRLGQYFGMSADFWMNLQSAYELDLARQQSGKAILRSPKRSEIAEPRPAV